MNGRVNNAMKNATMHDVNNKFVEISHEKSIMEVNTKSKEGKLWGVALEVYLVSGNQSPSQKREAV